jgi:hypothetical protein
MTALLIVGAFGLCVLVLGLAQWLGKRFIR